MKYIFVVHSHITYLGALGVIAEENPDRKDVLILSERYTPSSAPVPVTRMPLPVSFQSLWVNPKFLFTPYYLLDRLVDSFVGEDVFTLYIPACTAINKVLISHPKCCSFHFIEEGLSAYYDYYDINVIPGTSSYPFRYERGWQGIVQRLKAVRRVLGHSPRLDALPLFYNAYASDPSVICYGFSSYSHPHASTRRNLSLHAIVKHYDLKTSYRLDGSHIWIGDPRDTRITLAGYLEIIENSLIKYLLEAQVTSMYVKFHPREDPTSRMAFIKLMKDRGILCEVIPDDIILEIELLHSKEVTLLGVYSSLLFYGGLMDHTSFSIIRAFPSSNSNLSIDSYWQYVRKI